MNVNELTAATGYAQLQRLAAPAGKDAVAAFAATFEQADEAAASFAAKKLDTQSVVEAFSQAELALQAAITVRDRVVAAYQEVLRMPL